MSARRRKGQMNATSANARWRLVQVLETRLQESERLEPASYFTNTLVDSLQVIGESTRHLVAEFVVQRRG